MDAVGSATVTMRGGTNVLRNLHNMVGFRRRNQMRTDHWQGGSWGHSDCVNEDHGAKISHLVTPFGPTGPLQHVLPEA
jgi:hypothetical protein